MTTGQLSPATSGVRPLVRSVMEDGLPILTVTRGYHSSGRREVGGGLLVPVIVALSTGYHVERRTRSSLLRKTPTVGAVTVADPAERTVFTVVGGANVLQVSVPLRLIDEAAGSRVRSIRALFNEADPDIERSAMGALVALRSNDAGSGLLLHSLSYRLAAILGQHEMRPAASRRGGITSAALKRINDLLQAQLDEATPASPTLDELAQATGLSKHHFIKAFRETVGETPYAWVMRRRIERARALLTQPSGTVGDVAFQTGFSSPAHFVAAFRQRFGVTPGVFKNAVLN